MKILGKVLVAGAIILGSSLNAQTAFTVKSSLLSNTAEMSFGNGKFRPGFTFGYSGVSSKYSSTYSGSTNNYVDRLHLLLPGVNAKCFFNDSETTRPYLNVNVSLPIVMLKEKSDIGGQVEEEMTTGEFRSLMTRVGIGGEHFLSESFSIGGEFGYQMASLRFSGDDYSDRAGASSTYAAVSVNFYLGAKKE